MSTRYFEDGAEPYPPADSHILGLCTGSFAACAVSTSRTLSELVPAGVKAAIIAFRTALRSFEVRNDVEKPVPGGDGSWSAVINSSEANALEAIGVFCSENVSCFVLSRADPSLTDSRINRAPRNHT